MLISTQPNNYHILLRFTIASTTTTMERNRSPKCLKGGFRPSLAKVSLSPFATKELSKQRHTFKSSHPSFLSKNSKPLPHRLPHPFHQHTPHRQHKMSSTTSYFKRACPGYNDDDRPFKKHCSNAGLEDDPVIKDISSRSPSTIITTDVLDIYVRRRRKATYIDVVKKKKAMVSQTRYTILLTYLIGFLGRKDSSQLGWYDFVRTERDEKSHWSHLLPPQSPSITPPPAAICALDPRVSPTTSLCFRHQREMCRLLPPSPDPGVLESYPRPDWDLEGTPADGEPLRNPRLVFRQCRWPCRSRRACGLDLWPTVCRIAFVVSG